MDPVEDELKGVCHNCKELKEVYVNVIWREGEVRYFCGEKCLREWLDSPVL